MITDFGSYDLKSYSVQTGEGNTISNLMKGYIDLLISQQKILSQSKVNVQEESIVEDYIVKPK